jgi:hypothetical protein
MSPTPPLIDSTMYFCSGLERCSKWIPVDFVISTILGYAVSAASAGVAGRFFDAVSLLWTFCPGADVKAPPMQRRQLNMQTSDFTRPPPMSRIVQEPPLYGTLGQYEPRLFAIALWADIQTITTTPSWNSGAMVPSSNFSPLQPGRSPPQSAATPHHAVDSSSKPHF